jgi:predicted nuclease of predicted toxin-antitoxin system
MAEVLGAVASASQLAVLTMGLLNTVRKIKGASETLRKYQQQLQEVQVLSESISRNPLLQTPDVDFHTRSILVSISQNNLERRLQRSWLSRTCTFLYKDRDLVDFFIVLDRQKSSLSLVIENIQSRALHQIQSDIRAMNTTSPPFENPSTPPDSDDETSPKSISKLTSPRAMDRSSTTSPARDQTDKSTNAPDSQAKPETHPTHHTNVAGEEAVDVIAMAMGYFKRNPDFKGSFYDQNKAHDGVNIHLGALIDNKLVKGLKKPLLLNDCIDVYSKNESVGRGAFTGGVRREFSRDEVLSEDNYQPVYHNAYYHRNEGVAFKVEGSGSRSGSWATPTMQFGPSLLYKDAPTAVPKPAPEEK